MAQPGAGPWIKAWQIFKATRYTCYIIDCTEIFIETPKYPTIQKLAWSPFKHHNTIKFLVVCSFGSAITSLNATYSVRTSDKDITLDSVFSCDQAAIWLVQSVCPSVGPSVRPSVRPSHLFHHVPIIVSSWNFQELLPMTKVTSMQKVKVRGQRSRSQRSTPNLTVSGL